MLLPVICSVDTCDASFVPTHHFQTKCDEHKVQPDHVKPKSSKLCSNENCRNVVPLSKGNKPRTFCSDTCANNTKARNYQRKRRAAKKNVEIKEELADLREVEAPTERYRRGDLYVKMKDGLGEAIRSGEISQSAAAELMGSSKAGISRAYDAWEFDRGVEEAASEWQRSRFMKAQLPTEKLRRVRELGKSKTGRTTDEYYCLIDELVRAHVVFSRRWCQLEGERVIYKAFHIKWVRLLLEAFATGGKQMILSPPRHGKSELLIRFVLWLIIMDPNLRIMWVCANTDVAKLMLGAVKDYLTNHKELIAATLPPGESYKPPHGSTKTWSAKEIKVVQQSHIGAKSSSLLALGRTSKILSRDVDWLIVDDLEDFDTTREAGQRLYSRQKFAEIGTRKMKRTAWIYIGSRNHPDDVPNYLIKSGEKTRWKHVVYSAHDESCVKDSEEYDEHESCMLFDEVNDYEWLMEKKIEMDDLGLPGAYEMRYLNKPVPTEGIVFNMEQIKANALDLSRGIGLNELQPGHLIAGLDPSPRGVQAAVLWHYGNGVLNLVDIETQEAGGFAGALRIMENWHDAYGLTDWYYEDNSQQVEFFNDPRVADLKRDLGLTLRPHTTGKNKQDPELGISSMAPFYHDGSINLPYGTEEARRKVNVLLRQLELWTTDGVAKRKDKTDVKMASWFPFPRIVRWMRKDRHQNRIAGQREKGYPKMRSTNTFRRTPYPRSR